MQPGYILIIILSIIAQRINTRFTCLSYIIPTLYLGRQLLRSVGIETDLLNLAYTKLILLTGILHLLEGVLITIFGNQKVQGIITYRKNEIAGGYQAYGKWMIPLLLFSIQGIYVPVVAAIVYCNETFTEAIKQKKREMGAIVMAFGILLLLFYKMERKGEMMLSAVMLLMPLLHESIFIWDAIKERKAPIYTYPKKGIRLMDFTANVDKCNVFEKGDILIAINGKIINDEETYEKMRKEKHLLLQLKKLNGEEVLIFISGQDLEKLQPVFLPRQ